MKIEVLINLIFIRMSKRMGETIDWGDQVVTSCIVSKESDKQTKD